MYRKLPTRTVLLVFISKGNVRDKHFHGLDFVLLGAEEEEENDDDANAETDDSEDDDDEDDDESNVKIDDELRDKLKAALGGHVDSDQVHF